MNRHGEISSRAHLDDTLNKKTNIPNLLAGAKQIDILALKFTSPDRTPGSSERQFEYPAPFVRLSNHQHSKSYLSLKHILGCPQI